MRARLNFSPKPFFFRQKSLVLLWLLNLFAMAAIAVSAYYWWSLRGENFSVHQQIDNLRVRQRALVEQHGDLLADLDDIDLKQYSKQMKQFRGIETSFRTHWGRLMDELGTHLPEDVRIISLNPSGSRGQAVEGATQLRLSGTARHKDAELQFMQTLQGLPSFKNVRFEQEEYEDDQIKVNFEISFTYQPEEP